MSSILQSPKHNNLLSFARGLWNKMPNNENSINQAKSQKRGDIVVATKLNANNGGPTAAWPFYRRMFEKFEHYYHAFDIGILPILQEICQRAFMMVHTPYFIFIFLFS